MRIRRNLVLLAAISSTCWAGSSAIAAEVQTAMRTVAVETLVNTDIDTTWSELIRELSGRDYRVSASIRQDRSLQVLFQSEVPSHYVDCGEISVRSQHAQFGERNYKFLAANSVRYLVVDERANELVDVERRTSLNALANIHLTPVDQGTMVRVEAKYVMKFRTREFGTNVETRKADDTLNFDSTSAASNEEDIRQGATTKAVTVECRPTGALEQNIVSVLGDAS